MGTLASLFSYWFFIVIMMIGLYAAIARGNLVKKVIGLAVFQTGIFVFYISLGVIQGGTAPIFRPDKTGEVFANPLPHVLILTAIVVSVSTMAVALAIVVNIKREFRTIESDELLELEQQQEP